VPAALCESNGWHRLLQKAVKFHAEPRPRYMDLKTIRAALSHGKARRVRINHLIDQELGPSSPSPFSPEYRGEGVTILPTLLVLDWHASGCVSALY
ncbi:MAG: hypothetical protein SFV81_09890, partial [Pirellulaceae bacterium]|nr:hypothetical protein [Pirellulaceae bacterium]